MPQYRLLAFVFLLALPTALRAEGWPAERGWTAERTEFRATAEQRAADWPVPRGPSHEPAPFRYDPKASVPKAFLDDAGACVIYSGLTYLVEPDGNMASIFHEVTRLNSRKSIDRLGEHRSISWNPVWQKLTLHDAHVVKANGKVVPIEPRHLQIRDSNTDYLAYDRDKQLVISFPNLEIGDVIEVKWTTEGKNPEYFGHFFARSTFGDDNYPSMLEELRVRLPKNKDFKFATVNGTLEPTVQDEGTTRLYQWSRSNGPELPRDDSLPSKETLRLQVACSTFGTWAEVGLWKQKLRAKAWQSTPQIEKVVREVAGELTDPVAKAKALTYWVRKHIRYVSVSASGAGYTPQLPARVLSNLYGDCKDQSQLLAVMLREAGLHPELVTLGTLDDGQIIPEVPMPWGTHAILLVTIDGEDHWIDTTVTNAPWDYLPRDDRDRVTYVVDGSKLRLLRTPPLTVADSRSEMTTHLAVLPNGTAQFKRSAIYQGGSALAQRDAWFEAAPGERRRLVTAELQDADGRAKLRRLDIDEKSLVEWDGPVRAEMEYEIAGYFSGIIEKEGSLSDSRVWNRILSYTLDHERKVALDLGTPFESIHRYIVQLPPVYRFDGLPRDRQIVSRWGKFHLQVKPDAKDPRRVELVFHTRIDQPLVRPDEFAAFRAFHSDVHKSWRAWLNLTQTQAAADIPLLTLQFLQTPGDSISAATLARLLDSGGKPDQARHVLQVARFLEPADAALWEQSVKLAANVSDMERTYAAMLRQFPDQPRYALQLGAVRIKLGDHAGAKAVLMPLTKTAPEGLKAQAHLELARSLLAQRKPSAALKRLLLARDVGAENTRGTQLALLEGEVHEQLKDLAKAREAYRQVLTFESDNETALAALVRLEMAAGKRSEAADYLRRYAVAVGEDREGLTQAAAWYLELGRTEEALDLALRARSLRFNAKTQRVLGLIYAARGDHAKAVLHLSRADLDAEVACDLCRGYLALGKLDNAIEICGKSGPFQTASAQLRKMVLLVQRLADRRTGYLADARVAAGDKSAVRDGIDAFLCADLAFREGQPAAQVESLLAIAFAKSPEFAPTLALRGLLQIEHGKLTKALADAERALVLDLSEPRAYLVRGRVRLERADKEALGDLLQATQLSARRDGLILHWLAAAQFHAGMQSQALITQGEAAMLAPDIAEIREQLGEFQKAAKMAR